MNAKQTKIETRLEVIGKELKTAIRTSVEPATKWQVTDVTIGMTTTCIYLYLASDMTKRIELVYYSRDCGFYKKGQLTTNIASFGSFDTTSKSDIAEYYIEVGSLLSNKEMLDYLKKITGEFSGYAHELVKEYRDLNEKED